MSGQVDVLAVMDSAWVNAESQAKSDEMRKARAAVAALIAERDALRAALKEVEGCAEYWSEYFVPVGLPDRIRAALRQQPAPVVDDADVTEILALSLDEFGYHTEARNVRAGEYLDAYRTEMWAIRAALAREQGVRACPVLIAARAQGVQS